MVCGFFSTKNHITIPSEIVIICVNLPKCYKSATKVCLSYSKMIMATLEKLLVAVLIQHTLKFWR